MLEDVIPFWERHSIDRECGGYFTAPDGNWYFSLTREGRPFIQPDIVFSDCFAAMALARSSMAAKDEKPG